MRRLGLILACIAGLTASPAVAQTDRQALLIAIAEDALVRAVLERGAFAACFQRAPFPTESLDHVRQGWKADLLASHEKLRQSGLSEVFVTRMLARFDLERATPRFADPVALDQYCTVVGEWWTRYEQFRYIAPQLEITRRLQQR